MPLGALPAAWRPRAAGPVALATWRLAGVAACVSAAKVALFAVGSSAFLAAHGAAGLGWFYALLAALAASSSLLLAPQLERRCAARALFGLLLATALLAPAAGVAVALGAPGAAAGLLLLGHVFNIASEILLWVVAAAWLPVPDQRRATTWIYLATALGGFAGGLATERLLAFGSGTACAAVAVAASLAAALWLRRSLRLPNRGSARPTAAEALPQATAAGWRDLFAHPLGPLLGASSFMMTFVWGLTEFLCFSVYERRFADPAELARFLAALYAAQQLVELACVAMLAGPVTRHLSPVARTVLFPLGSLLSLLALGRSFELSATVVAHTHTEAVSNGLFDPVHASNFAAVPHRLQARVRALSEGVCYPLGMAASGFLLLAGPDQLDPEAVLAAAIGAACAFVAVALFTGAMVTSSLLQELGLAAEVGPAPGRAELRRAARALAPWARRTRLRRHLLRARAGSPAAPLLEHRVARADRRALAAAFARAKSCDSSGVLPRLELLIDSCRLELRALAAETLLSLPVRRLFVPFLPVLRASYLGEPAPAPVPAADLGHRPLAARPPLLQAPAAEGAGLLPACGDFPAGG